MRALYVRGPHTARPVDSPGDWPPDPAASFPRKAGTFLSHWPVATAATMRLLLINAHWTGARRVAGIAAGVRTWVGVRGWRASELRPPGFPFAQQVQPGDHCIGRRLAAAHAAHACVSSITLRCSIIHKTVDQQQDVWSTISIPRNQQMFDTYENIPMISS